jgi:GNAT superfamily N-acetyltransferase
LHDLVVHPAHRRQGLASYAIDKRVQLAGEYPVGSERVGMAYLEVDLGIAGLRRVVPLQDCFSSNGFTLNQHTLIRDYRHTS